jgi:Cu/Ag efflux pump CusA
MVAMASLFSTAPILFSQGIGSELQRPMALALIGGMSLGTVVSLFFIPLAYWYIYKGSEAQRRNGLNAQRAGHRAQGIKSAKSAGNQK